MSNLLQRVLVGLVGIPLFLGLLWLPPIVFHVFTFVLAILGTRELHAMARAKGFHPSMVISIIPIALTFLCLAFLGIYGTGEPDGTMALLFAVLLFTTPFMIASELWRNKEHALANMATNAFSFLYAGLGFIGLSMLRISIHHKENNLTMGGQGFSFVVSILVSIWVCDSAAYFVGKAFGKHKLWLRISPGKSWEGAIGGFVGALGACYLMMHNLLPGVGIATILVMGSLVGIAGPVGDLVESLMKRDSGIKDSSALLPGHGGVLDRFDSILFVAPIIAAIDYALGLVPR